MNFEQKSLQEVIKDIGINVADILSFMQDPENGDKEAVISSGYTALELVNKLLPMSDKVRYQKYDPRTDKWIMTSGDHFLDADIVRYRSTH